MSRPSPVLAVLSAAVLCLSPLSAQIPDGITFKPVFGTDGSNQFDNPAVMLEIPGKPGYFLVPEMRSGNIWVLSPAGDGYAKTLFGNVQGYAGEEDMGLVGFAFHPDFANNRKYYVKHGNPLRPPRQLLYDERVASEDYLHDSGQPGRRLLTIDLPNEFNDHNGGSPVFGPDGYLYLGQGDGGWDLTTPDAHKNGQNRESLLGKILRIDVDHKDPGLEYAIPKDNPFVGDANPNVRREIYAYGLRNPYRMTFDRATGEFYVGDIGWIKYDEVDIVKKGGNLGWSLKEGPYCLAEGTCGAPIEEPMAYMANGGGPGMAKCVIGGQIYRGDPASPFYGVYLFGDYTLKKLFALKKPATGTATVKEYPLVTPQEPIAFTVDRMNNIYMVGFSGTIYKLEHADLRPAATPVRSLSRQDNIRAVRRLAFLSGTGRIELPPGPSDRFEVLTPDGRSLGKVLRNTVTGTGALPVAAGTVQGLVFLRPL